MSYTVLARRYRSSTFDEVVGQVHVAQTLKRAIESGRIAHAYLFCGTRGTGKTSMARIFAKALNCDRFDKATTTPCGECSSCQAIARGEDIDVIELDAASNRGIDEVRKIIENSRLSPARSRYKVYIIDEVHAMTKEAFNSLLKVLEEPASHVKFILATTEPEKVLPTILSRCQRYDFQNIAIREIANHLKSVCEKEGITAEPDALLMLARAGNGSMRDAISVLDRMLSAGEKTLSGQMVEELLGMPRGQLIYDLAQKIGEGDVGGTLSQLEAMLTTGLSPDSLLAALIEHLRNLMVIGACGAKSDLVEATTVPGEDLLQQATRFDLVFLSQDIVILEELRRQIRQTQAHRALLDATLVRLALTEQFTPIGELAENQNAVAALPAAQKKKIASDSPAAPEPAPAAEAVDFTISPAAPATTSLPLTSATCTPTPPQAESLTLKAAVSAPVASPVLEDPPDDGDALPAVGKVWNDGEKLSLSAAMARGGQGLAPSFATVDPTPAANPAPAAADAANLADVWKRLLEAAGKMGNGVAVPLAQGKLLRIDEEQVVVHFSSAFAHMAGVLQHKKDALREKLQAILDRPVGLVLQADAPPATGAAPAPTSATISPGPAPRGHLAASPAGMPAAPPAPASIPLTPELRHQLSADPLIRGIMEQLGGTLVRVEKDDV